MQNIGLITLAWELHNSGIPQLQIARDIGKNRDTIRLWVKGIRQFGLIGFLDMYEQTRKGSRTPRKANPVVKRYRYFKISISMFMKIIIDFNYLNN